MTTGFSTNNQEIAALLDALAELTGLTKTEIVKQALLVFKHDDATVQLMKLRRLIYGQAQEDAHGR